MKNKLILLAAAAVTALSLPSCVPVDYVGVGYTNEGYASLPRGYSTVYVGGSPYYYSSNYWYRRSNGRYLRCSRPHGYHGSIGRNARHRHTVKPSYGYRGHNSYHRSRGVGYRTVSTPARPTYGSRGYSGYRGRTGSGSSYSTRHRGYNRSRGGNFTRCRLY